MTADTLKTTRVLELYQDFLSGKLINKQQAAEQYHVNVRSIQRDIDSIRDFLSEQCAKEGIVRKIEYDKKENGYRLVTQEIEQLSKGEVLALCKILLESRAFTKEQVEKQLQIILNLCVSQKEKSDIEWFISNELFHYHDPAHATVDSDNLWMVAQAIRNQSVLEIEYQKLKDRQIVKRMVEPVGLMFSEYYFYLMAVITDHSTREAFHKKNDPYPTIYRLDRIHSIKETGEKFSVPYKDRFKEGEYKNRTQFMFGGEPQKISFNYYSTVTYTNDVNQAFSDLVANVSRRGMQYANNTVASRGGYMAENFVADSYNLDATIKRSDAPRATVPEENGLSSPDIQYGDEQASLKFYKDAKSSAMRQSDPGYGDQHRIVPSDQVDDAKAELAKKAQENRAKGRENAATQQEKTRDLIDDRIHGKDGTESTPMTKKQNDDLSKTIKKDENGNAYVDNEAMDKVMEDTGIKGKVKNAIRKNEIQGLASAVAIGAGIGFTIGFAVSLAQSGITPDSVKYAFVNGGKSGVASGVQSVVGYGIGRTIGQVATNAIEGVLSNAGLEITANISKMCTMGTVGAITVAVFSTVQFVKLIYRGECLKSAAIQVGKQALFSLSLLAISIAAQGMWGGPAGIIVSIGTGIVIVSYTIADAVHQRTFAEECHIKTIEEYGRLALRHLNELQFA